MKCKNCGNELEQNYLFCNKCGLKVGEEIESINQNKSSKITIILSLILLIIPIILGVLYFKYQILHSNIFYYISLSCFIGIIVLVLIDKQMTNKKKSFNNILGVVGVILIPFFIAASVIYFMFKFLLELLSC